MAAAETYQAVRSRDLGLPEGVGKRYNFADLQRFIVESETLAEKPRHIAVNLLTTELGTTIGDIEGMSPDEARARLVVLRANGEIDFAILNIRGVDNQLSQSRALMLEGDRVALLNKARNGIHIMVPAAVAQ